MSHALLENARRLGNMAPTFEGVATVAMARRLSFIGNPDDSRSHSSDTGPAARARAGSTTTVSNAAVDSEAAVGTDQPPKTAFQP